MDLRLDAESIIKRCLLDAQPDRAVKAALSEFVIDQKDRLLLLAIGKAAWQMAKATTEELGSRVSRGMVITKYGHAKGSLPGIQIFEAGHPVPDEAGILAGKAAMEMVSGLTERDTVLFLVSGGGSALFEVPTIPLMELRDITEQMLRKGLDIKEINAVRKRLSLVKGGRFAEKCMPARVVSVILSDVLGDPLDMIASGPAYPDTSTTADALSIIHRYGLSLSESAMASVLLETPKSLTNVISRVSGSVSQLCASAAEQAKALGYEPLVLTASLACEARDAGLFMAAIAEHHQRANKSLAFIAGGETVVTVKGQGKGGRNQELVLSAVKALSNCRDTCLFSLGSDGTDGPTDAAGGYADSNAFETMMRAGIDPLIYLADNNAYPALKALNGLLMTGPTGTNVNDVTVLLIRR